MNSQQIPKRMQPTSDERADAAVPRLSGSIERRVCSKFTLVGGRSLKESWKQPSHGSCGLKVSKGGLVLFQNSVGGLPQSLKILFS